MHVCPSLMTAALLLEIVLAMNPVEAAQDSAAAQDSVSATGRPGAALLKGQPPIWSANPDIAAFEALENRRLDAARRAIDALHAAGLHAAGKKPTLRRTLTLYDGALRSLNAAFYLSSDMEAVHPDATFRDHATAMTRKVSAAQTALSLDPGVYHALQALDISRADKATRHYVERQLLEFKLGGVDKDAAVRTRLKALNDELTTELSSFERNINDDHRSVAVTDASELDGMPADYIDRHRPNDKGEIVITTDYPDYLPAMRFARSDDLRHRLFVAFEDRAFPANQDVLMHLLRTRDEIATLLGYDSWANYNAADKMTVRAATIADFIEQVDLVARPDADREFKMLLAEKRKRQPEADTIQLDERSYYQEEVRRSHYDFDSQTVRPYFPYPEVRQGVLDTAATLFHLKFRREAHVRAWDPLVETWLVFDGGEPIGRFYLDMHPRSGKFTHAEMAPVLDGIRGRQLPEAMLICNFPQPTDTDAALMTYEEVTTFFHEFGHLMHWILGGSQEWAGISGISMEADFVEAPSQMLEEWMHSPQVLASFARHFQTGQPIPSELVERMNTADAFGRAGWVAIQNSYSAVSFDIYSRKPQSVDLDAITHGDTVRYTPYMPIQGTHDWASFGHLAGYSSAYYTYLWDKVIAEDFFAQFDPHNLLAGDTPMRYRRAVLEPGGSESANDLVRNFLGRAQNIGALRRWMSAEFASQAP